MRKETLRRTLSLFVAFVFLLTSTGSSVFAAATKITAPEKTRPTYYAGQTKNAVPKKIPIKVIVPAGTSTPQAIRVSIAGDAAKKFFLAADATVTKSAVSVTQQRYNVPTSSALEWDATAYLGIVDGKTPAVGDRIKITITDVNSPETSTFDIVVAGSGGTPSRPPAKQDDKSKKPTTPTTPTTPEKPVAETDGRFNDVRSTDWFHNDVEYVVTNKLFTGVSAGAFGPHASMTRGMIVTVIGRLNGVDTSAYTSRSFDDVALGQYYAAYVEWAKSNGIVKGIDGNNFAPDAEVSRQDLTVILLRYAEFAKKTIPTTRQPILFADDSKIAGYAKNAVQTLYGSAIVNGTSENTFGPTESATRAEVAAMLHRFVETTKK
jgi:hypothetical protein